MATSMLRGELLLMFGTVITGGLLATAYYFLCLLRRILPHSRALVGTEDILFFAAAALLAYTVIYRLGNGVVRYYAAAGLCVGAFSVVRVVGFVQKRLKKGRRRRTMKRTESQASSKSVAKEEEYGKKIKTG